MRGTCMVHPVTEVQVTGYSTPLTLTDETPTGAVPVSVKRLLFVLKLLPPLLVMANEAATELNCCKR